MNRSYFGGFLVNPGPTNVALVTIRFHCLAAFGNKSTDIYYLAGYGHNTHININSLFLKFVQRKIISAEKQTDTKNSQPYTLQFKMNQGQIELCTFSEPILDTANAFKYARA
jgi:hypothetical protein